MERHGVHLAGLDAAPVIGIGGHGCALGQDIEPQNGLKPGSKMILKSKDTVRDLMITG